MKLRGTVDMSLSSRGVFSIRLFDSLSNQVVCEIELTPEQMALGMSGRAAQEVMFEPGDRLDLVGMTVERKNIALPDRQTWHDGAGAFQYLRDDAKRAELRAAYRKRMLSAALDTLTAGELDGPTWELAVDGVGTQQNGTGWNCSLKRYLTPEQAHARALKESLS